MSRAKRITGPCLSGAHDRAPLTCEECVYELLTKVRGRLDSSDALSRLLAAEMLDTAIARIEADRAADVAYLKEAE